VAKKTLSPLAEASMKYDGERSLPLEIRCSVPLGASYS
jgi:hypothetical protein